MYFRNYEDLKSYLADIKLSETEKLMIFVGDKSSSNVSDLMSYLNSKKINFFGGIYSGLLVGNKNESAGFIVKKVEPVYSSLVLPYMMRIKIDPETLNDSTAIVLVDGLSSKMLELTDTIYGKLGKNVKYVGGGAGFYNLSHQPCIFNNDGIFMDALYICIIKSKVKLEIEHGWKKLRGPFIANKSYDNILSELNGENAFEVYKDIIEDEEKIVLSKEDFFTFSKDHPFGISEGFGRVIVRDPIALNDKDEIVCVASIPQGSEVYILKGDSDMLLASSLNIAELCTQNAPQKYTPLLFNCISRAMFLEEKFCEELNNIQSKMNYIVEGALSIGEISSKINGEIIIHNKSTVLALLYNDEELKSTL